MSKMFGRLMEGTSDAIGIVEDQSPSYTGRCRVCHWSGGRFQFERDAENSLSDHIATPLHRERVLRAVAVEFEQRVTAK